MKKEGEKKRIKRLVELLSIEEKFLPYLFIELAQPTVLSQKRENIKEKDEEKTNALLHLPPIFTIQLSEEYCGRDFPVSRDIRYELLNEKFSYIFFSSFKINISFFLFSLFLFREFCVSAQASPIAETRMLSRI